MKIRVIAVIFTVIMLATGIFCWRRLDSRESKPVDMLTLNTEVDEISAALSAGEDCQRLEEQYDCDIIFVSDSDYKSVNNAFIKNRFSIFDLYEDGQIAGKVAFDTKDRGYDKTVGEQRGQLVLILGVGYLAGLLLLLVIWYYYIRPFNKLCDFADQVSKGNLDIPLRMTRHNYFGAFTESFDRMRDEMKQSVRRENDANRSKQELVAELSHDIKTPVATILATTEVMEMKYKDKDILEKVSVIKSKAGSVEHLVDNMFRAALDELEELKVQPREESSLIINEILNDLKFYGEVIRENDVPECLIYADRLRLEQVIDNIAGNSFKYAGTPLTVSFRSGREHIHMTLADRGPGVTEEELVMLTSKFYRGSAAADSGKDGSGLGLYLASDFMKRMDGGLELRNREGGGFEAEIIIKKI